MTVLFYFTESKIFALIYSIIFRKKIFFLPRVSGDAFSEKLLISIENFLIKVGRAENILAICPELTPDWEHPLTMLENIFEKIECWQREKYNFDRSSERLGEYDLAYKQVVSNYIANRLLLILAVKLFRSRFQESEIQFIGIPCDILEAIDYYGIPVGTCREGNISKNYLLNLFLTFCTIAFGVLWISKRTRFFSPPITSYDVMVDYVNDPDDVRLYPEMSDDGNILLLLRSRHFLESAEKINNYPHVLNTSARFNIFSSLTAFIHIIYQSFTIYLFSKHCSIALYRILITMPVKRIYFRGLFNRFRPKYFWGRDAYNVEHILRRYELNKVGGKSICPLNGYPSYAPIYPMFRYLSCDYLYSISRSFYEKTYVETWSPDVTVIEANSFRVSREIFADRIPAKDKPGDILILCALYLRSRELIDFVRHVSRSFPDRKIYLQLKPRYRQIATGKDFVERCCDGSQNIHVVEASPYDMFQKVKYVFSDPSTAVMEAIQFGSMAFAIDFPTIHVMSPFREHPTITVNDGASAVEKIRLLEADSWDYPIDELRQIAHISGQCFQDRLRADIGLRPLGPQRTVW